jgi:hypothetical protein
MSLYRSPGRRSWGLVALALVVGLVIGGVAGYLGGQAGEESPSLGKGLEQAQETIRPAVDGISLISVEYPIGVRDGTVVVPEQLQGAKDQLARVKESFADAQADLVVIDPDGTAKVAADLDRLGAKLEALAPVEEVDALVTRIESELRGVARLS